MSSYLDRPGLLHNVSQYSHCVVIGHVFKVDVIDLEDHVARLNSPVQSHGPALHDAANVDAAVTSLVTLTNNGDSQEVDGVHVEGHCDDVQ